MKRLPLSLNIAPASKAALLARAEREGHRYPAVLAATLLERSLREEDGGGASVDPDVVADVAARLATGAKNLRVKGALSREGAEGLADLLDELAGRLGGAGPVQDEHEAALSPTSRAALQAGLESARTEACGHD